jgi:ABC-type transport system involved in multi-copper enzyme maturation permease subunit
VFTKLRPIFALFVRSLREQSRAKLTSISRGAIALLILLFIVGNERNFTNNSAPGQWVLVMLVMLNFFAIAIFGLSTFASAITEEKEDDTLGLLQMTRLNPLAILLGKSTARLCEGLLLLAVQVPFTMLCITLGGVSLDQVLRCYAILAAFLFLLCNVALLWSVVCRRTGRATAMTALTGVIFYVIPLFLFPIALGARFSGRTVSRWYESVSQWSISINPVLDLTRTVVPRGSMPFATDSMAFSLIGGMVCFALAWLLFAPCCNSGAEPVAQRREKVITSAGRPRSARSRPGNRAIAWKDFHFHGGGWRGLVIRFVVYVAIALLLIWWVATIDRSSLGAESIGIAFWMFGVMAFSIEIGLVSARIFGIERKRKTLGTLYTLPIGTGRLVREKILGALPQLLPSAAVASLGLALLTMGRDGRFWRLDNSEYVAGWILGVSQYALFAVLVMYLSLRMRRAAFAAGLSIMFAAFMFVGFFADSYRGDGISLVLMLCVITWVATVVVASRIPHRIAIAAAAD